MQFSKDSTNLTNPTNSHKSLVLWDSFQKICFVDSFRDTIFKRFVLWIRFVRKKVKKVRFVSIRKDSCTNPASLQNTQKNRHFYLLNHLRIQSINEEL
jgi:hypothetical protein